VFFPAPAHPRQTSSTAVAGGGESVTVNTPIQLQVQPGFASATEEHLERAQLTFGAAPLGATTITVCG
jgi:hypothetical protein